MDVREGREIRRAPADGRGATTWFIPAYKQILKARQADPNIFTDAAGHSWVIGKGKRFITPEEAQAWGMDAQSAAEAPPQARVLDAAPNRTVEVAEPAAADAAQAQANAPATGPPADSGTRPAREEEQLIPRVVWDALKKNTHSGPTRQIAQQILDRARKIAKQRGEPLSDEELAQVIAHIAYLAPRHRPDKCVYYLPALDEQLGKFFGERRAAREQAPQSEPAGAPVAEDPVVRTELCPKCGGTTEYFASGLVSWCACQSRKKGKGHA